jgi:hypothetical protein
MPIVDNDTANRDYDLPHPSNNLSDDVARLISALNAVDADIALLFAGLALKAASVHGHTIADVTGLQAALDSKAGTGSPIAMALVTGLLDALAAKADLASPTLTGTPSAPTPSTGDNSTRIPTTAWVRLQNYLTGIADGAITAAKLANGAVTAGKIADGGVDQTGRIADGIITLAKLANGTALSITARASNTDGVRADLAASANGQILSRLSNALGFNTLTAVLDAVFGNTQGRLLRRGASAWEAADVSLESMTLLGTIATTSGTSQGLTGLTLTGYKFLMLDFRGLSTSGSGAIQIGAETAFSTPNAAFAAFGQLLLSLTSGRFSGVIGGTNVTANSGYSDASTAVTLTAVSAGNFDAGAVDVYGMK